MVSNKHLFFGRVFYVNHQGLGSLIDNQSLPIADILLDFSTTSGFFPSVIAHFEAYTKEV